MIGTKKVMHIVGQLAATIPGNISPFSVVRILWLLLIILSYGVLYSKLRIIIDSQGQN